MTRLKTTRALTLCLPLALSAGMAGAEAFPLAERAPQDAAASSPFAFAQSGAKAERAAEAAAEAEASGARVIGGQIAAEGAWPWQVGLMIASQPVGPDAHFCGGSMLLERWVLTAAHCIHMEDGNGGYADLPTRAISVLVGTNELVPGKGDLVPVAGIYRHPSYVGSEFDHDIALIKLARAPQVAYSTITVPDADFGDYLDQAGVTTIVTGWGLINGGIHPSEMREAQIQMLSRDQCNNVLIQDRAAEAARGFSYAAQVFGLRDDAAQEAWRELVARVPMPMSENMLCSGTYEGGRTACQGDSGGPLVVPLQDGKFVQAGVVSWGLSSVAERRCAEDAKFSAYTRVSNYLPWLEQTISANR